MIDIEEEIKISQNRFSLLTQEKMFSRENLYRTSVRNRREVIIFVFPV